jgi:hypothetical protein
VLIETDMEEAILMAGQGALSNIARERAERAINRAQKLGLQKLAESALRLLGNGSA